MLASSSPTYCCPIKLSRTLAVIDRIDAERVAYNRAPHYMQKPGHFSGVDAVIIYRDGEMQPVALPDLTALELDRLLTVPAFAAVGRA